MFSNNFVVVYDSCILYSAYLRDLLIEMALKEVFRAKWTKTIHEEWLNNLLNKRPELSKEKLERTISLMNEEVPDSLVENYESLIESLELPDPSDRHVLAAAIKANAQVIVTYNLKDFPKAELQKYNIEAQDPDNFLDNLINLAPDMVLASVKEIQTRLKNPTKTIDELIEIYNARKLESLCTFLQENLNQFV
ncbi:MAG: PIN domain-containing protein [Candidatus Caenarcaniphilales bacterium]|nr:PIN domain-containing protein [Candidatus Caenarcaniphilales bacterium]